MCFNNTVERKRWERRVSCEKRGGKMRVNRINRRRGMKRGRKKIPPAARGAGAPFVVEAAAAAGAGFPLKAPLAIPMAAIKI
jgi:hypothetical protein